MTVRSCNDTQVGSRISIHRFGAALVLICICACVLLVGCGRSEPTEPIEIADAWAPALPPNATTGAAYMRIIAHKPDRLVGASSLDAHSVELHRTSVEDGVAAMRPVDSVSLDAGEALTLEPGGAHFMLVGMVSPLEAGKTIQLELHFEHAGVIEVQVPVMEHGGDHEHH